MSQSDSQEVEIFDEPIEQESDMEEDEHSHSDDENERVLTHPVIAMPVQQDLTVLYHDRFIDLFNRNRLLVNQYFTRGDSVRDLVSSIDHNLTPVISVRESDPYHIPFGVGVEKALEEIYTTEIKERKGHLEPMDYAMDATLQEYYDMRDVTNWPFEVMVSKIALLCTCKVFILRDVSIGWLVFTEAHGLRPLTFPELRQDMCGIFFKEVYEDDDDEEEEPEAIEGRRRRKKRKMEKINNFSEFIIKSRTAQISGTIVSPQKDHMIKHLNRTCLNVHYGDAITNACPGMKDFKPEETYLRVCKIVFLTFMYHNHCDQSEKILSFVLWYWAHMHIHDTVCSGVIAFLIGDQGTGKTLLMQMIADSIGDHHAQIVTDSRGLGGNGGFGDPRLTQSQFIGIDDPPPGSLKGQHLKTLATNPSSVHANFKHQKDRTPFCKTLNMFFSSNNPSLLSSSAQGGGADVLGGAGDRRSLVIESVNRFGVLERLRDVVDRSVVTLFTFPEKMKTDGTLAELGGCPPGVYTLLKDWLLTDDMFGGVEELRNVPSSFRGRRILGANPDPLVATFESIAFQKSWGLIYNAANLRTIISKHGVDMRDSKDKLAVLEAHRLYDIFWETMHHYIKGVVVSNSEGYLNRLLPKDYSKLKDCDKVYIPHELMCVFMKSMDCKDIPGQCKMSEHLQAIMKCSKDVFKKSQLGAHDLRPGKSLTFLTGVLINQSALEKDLKADGPVFGNTAEDDDIHERVMGRISEKIKGLIITDIEMAKDFFKEFAPFAMKNGVIKKSVREGITFLQSPIWKMKLSQYPKLCQTVINNPGMRKVVVEVDAEMQRQERQRLLQLELEQQLQKAEELRRELQELTSRPTVELTQQLQRQQLSPHSRQHPSDNEDEEDDDE